MSATQGHKTALVSPFTGINYGTLLQAYSLAYVLRGKGCDSEYIAFTPYYKRSLWERIVRKLNKGLRRVFRISMANDQTPLEDYSYMNTSDFMPLRRVLDAFVSQHIPHSSIVYNPRTIGSCKGYAKYVVGSDQTWSIENCDKNAFYFLPWVKSKCKYAYAPSLGTISISDVHHQILTKYLPSFRYLSCREKTNCAALSACLHKPVEPVLDPTMLISADDWRQFAVSTSNLPKRYILAYILGTKSCISDFAERLSLQTGLPVYYVLTCPTYLHKPNVLRDMSPQQWVYAIDHAAYVVTDSFHGSLFCINLNTNFYAFAKRPQDVWHVLNDNDRIMELLQTFGLTDRFVNDEDVRHGNVLTNDMDYSEANRIVSELRQLSLNYLQKIVEDK